MIESLILYLILLSLAVYPVRNKKKILEKLGFKKTDAIKETKYALSALLLMLFTAMVIGAIFYSLGFTKDASAIPNIIKKIELWQVLTILVIGSIVEEIFFRGYIQRKTNIITASFIFSYFHIIYSSITEVTGAFFLGLILGYLYDKRKNLFAPSLAHLLYNLTTICLIYLI